MIQRALIIFVTLLITVLLETALLSNIIFLPAVPDLLLLLVLYISIYGGSLSGEASGFTSGLLLDFLTAAPLGLNCLLRTLLGFIVGLFHNILNVSGVIMPALLALVATIVKAFIIEFISFFFPIGIITYDFVSFEFGIELLLNTVLAPLVFSFLSLFSTHLVANKEIEH